jgi:hypothetical protein
MDTSFLLLCILVAILTITLARTMTPSTFVAANDSVGCEGQTCYIRNKSVAPVQRYNNLNSWYVYGPQNPPFIGWLRQQIAVSDNNAVDSYAHDLQLPGA